MPERDPMIIDGKVKEIPTKKRLYRSTTHRAVAGVAGGLAEFFGWDVGVVRVLWLVLGVLTLGAAWVVYALLARLIPQEPPEYAVIKAKGRDDLWQRLKTNPILLWGSMLLWAGVVWLLNNLHVLPWRLDAVWQAISAVLAPVVLIGLGIYLILAVMGRAPDLRQLTRTRGELQRFGLRWPVRRSRSDRQLAGVCGGLAAYWRIDSLVVRLVCMMLSVLAGGLVGVVLYGLAALLIPSE